MFAYLNYTKKRKENRENKILQTAVTIKLLNQNPGKNLRNSEKRQGIP